MTNVTVSPATATGTTTTFTLAVAQQRIKVFIGRLFQVPGTDYNFTAGATSFTTTYTPVNGEPVNVRGETL